MYNFLGLDLESVMALQTDLTSDEELSTTIDLSDAQAIRKQLDGLENMYTEVLKLLGRCYTSMWIHQFPLILQGVPKKNWDFVQF